MGNITFKMFFLLTALLGYNFAMAQTGAPHTLRGESQVASVSLNWKSPAEAKTMQWHNDTPYNGVSGVRTILKNIKVQSLMLSHFAITVQCLRLAFYCMRMIKWYVNRR